MMSFVNKRRALSSVASVAVAVAIGASSAVAQETTTLDVLLPNERTTVFYPHFLCAELGYFEDEGLEINLLSSATTVPYVAFLSNGDADIVMLDSAQTFQAVNTDQPISVIYEDMQFAPESVFVSADSEVQEIADLKGTTVGLVSDRDRITLSVALKSANMTLDDVQTAVVGEAGATLANAFRNQTVSAVAGGASDMSAVEANDIKIRNITPPEVSENPANSFVLWTPRIEELREPVQKFLVAWTKCVEAGIMDKEFATAILKEELPEQYENMDVGLSLLNRSTDVLRTQKTDIRGNLQSDVWARVQAPYIEIGEIKGQLDPATFLDDSFIEELANIDKEAIKADIEEYKQANPDKFQ
jgi:NitT/TauT family transport system substrate-binding protein